MKVADFVKRPRGESVLPEDWHHRSLPKPTVNMAIATPCNIEEFTEDCKEFRFNSGVGGNVLFKDETSCKTWFEETRMLLLRKGFSGVSELLLRLHSNDIFDEEQKDAIQSLQTYLNNNRERLNFCERLFEGRAIGSGVVEGTCKNIVGRRLKQTGACWRKQRAEKMAVICAAIYSKQW
ncbi:MAG: hypothetical protein LBU65_03580, partial [Planctomycetaceae bacterium]|nr:hypothetical protein [Planctomycetaceae bacterium]